MPKRDGTSGVLLALAAVGALAGAAAVGGGRGSRSAVTTTLETEGIWYHGSERVFDELRTRRAATVSRQVHDVPIFLTRDRTFALLHARGPTASLYEVCFSRPARLWSPDLLYREGGAHWPPTWEWLTPLGQELDDDLEEGRLFPGSGYVSDLFKAILRANWDVVEHPSFMRWLGRHGFEGFQVRGESNPALVSIAVFDPSILRIVRRSDV